MKYEVLHHHVGSAEDECAALISILTGLEVEEVYDGLPERLRKSTGWFGRDFAASFRALGYDCSPDFRARFDPETPYPCLLRYVPGKRLLARETIERRRASGNPDLKPDRWWNVLAYYDGLVYDPSLREPFPLSDFNKAFTITTMMQVWVGKL